MSAFDTWAAQLRARLDDPNTCDTELSRLLGTPQVTDVPRPGDARAWEFSDWTNWGTAWGFTETGRTTHNFMLVHKDFSGLRLGMATTTSDTRSRMNLASSFRLCVRAFNQVAREAVLLALLDAKAKAPLGPDYDSVLRPLIIAAYSDGRAKRAAELEGVNAANGVMASPTPFWSRLYKQATREKISPRQLLSRLLTTIFADNVDRVDYEGYAASSHVTYTESVYASVSKGVGQPIQLVRLLTTALNDYIDTYDVIKDEEREARAAARANATKGTGAPATPDQDPDADLEGDDAAAVLTTQLNQTIDALSAFAEAAGAKDRRIANLSTSNDVLRKTVQDLQDKCAALQTARDAAFSTAAALESEHKTAQQLLAETAAVKDWKPTLAALVETLTAHLSSSDFLALASGISHAKIALADAATRLALDEP